MPYDRLQRELGAFLGIPEELDTLKRVHGLYMILGF